MWSSSAASHVPISLGDICGASLVLEVPGPFAPTTMAGSSQQAWTAHDGQQRTTREAIAAARCPVTAKYTVASVMRCTMVRRLPLPRRS